MDYSDVFFVDKIHGIICYESNIMKCICYFCLVHIFQLQGMKTGDGTFNVLETGNQGFMDNYFKLFWR